jgi:Flp pilus assembly protein TadG
MVLLSSIRSRRARLGSERGAEIIELALVTPIFAILIAGMFDFGFLFRNWEVVTNAAREGARVGVLPDYACDDTTTDVKDRVDAYMASAGVTDTTSYTVDVDTTDVDPGAGTTFSACRVVIELTQPLPSLSVIGALTGGGFGDVAVRAASIMRTETQALP